MKQKLICLGMSLFLLNLAALQAQRLSFTPAQPLPGEKITIRYNPQGTALEDLESFDATAFLMTGSSAQPTAVEIAMTKEGAYWKGEFKTEASTSAVLLSFKNEEEEKEDNNDEAGYMVLMFQNNRKAPVQGALAAQAGMFTSWASLAGLKRNEAKAVDLWKQEFSNYPASMGSEGEYSNFVFYANRQKDEAVIAEAMSKAGKIAENKKATEKELLLARSIYSRLKQEDKAKDLEALAIKKFPKGQIAQQQQYTDFRKEKDPNKKQAIFEQFKKQYGKTESGMATLNNMALDLATAFSDLGDWKNFEKYLAQVTDQLNRVNLLNSIAWTLSGESLEAEGKDLAMGLNFSASSLSLLEELMKSGEGKPSYYTAKAWKNRLENSYAMYADTYALLAFKNGKAEDALKYQQIAAEKFHFNDGEMVERYAVYLEKVKGGKEAEAFLATMMAEGKANSAAKAQHKRLFLANNTLESAYDKYLVSIEKEALAAMKEELKKNMLDDAAPNFKLLNMNGEEVSLEGLRGKVVVVDFWATWCGPCKASFPGMQRAVNKFEKSDDVAFVFIDTWESGEPDAKKTNAKKFINSKAYTFNVLFDLDDSVVKSYGVSGIPTKFVVDKKGIIRFKSVGFGGNDDELVNEITLMIEMAGGQIPQEVTSAP